MFFLSFRDTDLESVMMGSTSAQLMTVSLWKGTKKKHSLWEDIPVRVERLLMLLLHVSLLLQAPQGVWFSATQPRPRGRVTASTHRLGESGAPCSSCACTASLWRGQRSLWRVHKNGISWWREERLEVCCRQTVRNVACAQHACGVLSVERRCHR